MQFLNKIDRHLKPYLKRSINRVPDVECLRKGVDYQIHTGGKRIRAALCASACEIFSGSYMRSLSFAAAIEHLQNFMLIHDDIADGDTMRRFDETVWKRYGIAHGINIGDVFISLSALAILESIYPPTMKIRLLQIFSEFSLETAEGQSLDIGLRMIDSVTPADYMKCTLKKTGSFLAMATVGGAIIGGANEEHIQTLKDFAFLAGVAFQIKDDLLDVFGTKGRSIGSDILEGKRTLMVAHSSAHTSGVTRKRLFRILNKPRARNTTSEINWVFELYRNTGAIEYAELIGQRLVKQATEHLWKLPETEAKYRLIRISKYLGTRAS